MTDREIISVALCGFEADPVGTSGGLGAREILGLVLEKALHEAELLRMATQASNDTLTAGSLWARLKALDAFIQEHMDVEFKSEDGAEQSESEAAE